MMRAVGFNKPQVDLFYDNLEKPMKQYKFTASRIYNCDETGVAPKAIRQVGKLTSAERGKNITVLFCMSANGHYIPPFFVFPRQRMNKRLMMNAPAESIGVGQPKGWMNSDFFLQYLRLFIKHTQPTKEKPILLLLDGHCSHRTLAIINFCRENHIHLMSSPPHTTHKLQPLDRTFMKPFKNAYSQQCDLWMRTNAGCRLTDYDIAGLVTEAFIKVARLEIAVSGFKCTGIYPFDRHLFSDLDYLAADMTNIPLEQTETSSNALNNEQAVVILNSMIEDQMTTSPKPSTSSAPDLVQIIHKLSPLPDAAEKRTAARKRKSERSEILTSLTQKSDRRKRK
uniref:Putative mariner-21 hm n=1 Tax=Xenopsylla cheopis TaxID=163159 RepID=A0A6M2DMK8_XENCH